MRNLFAQMNLLSKLSAVWMALMTALAVFGWLIPLPDPREYDPEAAAVGLFSPGHLLGTDAGGYD
ncbi:MAG: ABC transporter permease, partial [Ilumatobacteraceae bacterium]